MVASFMISTILLIVLGLILFLLAWLLFSPLTLRVDTADNRYEIFMPGVIKMQLDTGSDEIGLELRTPLFRKRFYPFRRSEKKQEAEAQKKPDHHPEKPRRKSPMTRGKFIKILHSFRIREFRCTVDTDDYVQNALLVPVFQVMAPNRLTINFRGECYLKFMADNTIWRLGTAWLTG